MQDWEKLRRRRRQRSLERWTNWTIWSNTTSTWGTSSKCQHHLWTPPQARRKDLPKKVPSSSCWCCFLLVWHWHWHWYSIAFWCFVVVIDVIVIYIYILWLFALWFWFDDFVSDLIIDIWYLCCMCCDCCYNYNTCELPGGDGQQKEVAPQKAALAGVVVVIWGWFIEVMHYKYFSTFHIFSFIPWPPCCHLCHWSQPFFFIILFDLFCFVLDSFSFGDLWILWGFQNIHGQIRKAVRIKYWSPRWLLQSQGRAQWPRILFLIGVPRKPQKHQKSQNYHKFMNSPDFVPRRWWEEGIQEAESCTSRSGCGTWCGASSWDMSLGFFQIFPSFPLHDPTWVAFQYSRTHHSWFGIFASRRGWDEGIQEAERCTSRSGSKAFVFT